MKHALSEVTLSTGTKGLLIDVPGSEVINIKLFFRAGFQLADRDKYEAPHLIEHHVFNGSEGFPRNGQLFTELSKNGAWSNATTNPYFITYLNECAAFEYERIMDLYIDLIQRPIFPAEQYIKERENVRSELTKNLSEYATQAYILTAEQNFPKVWLNHRTRLDQLDDISHDDVVEHYRDFHESANAAFVISGDIQANRGGIVAKLEQLYGGLPRGTRRELEKSIGLGVAGPIMRHEDIASDNFNLSWFAAPGTEAEQAAGHLLSTILTGSFLSRILGAARDRGLTYSVNSGSSANAYSSSFVVSGFANPGKLKDLFELIATELEAMVVEGPSPEELAAAKERVMGGIKVRTQTVSAIAGWYASDYAFDGTIQSYDEYFDLIQGIGIGEVQRFAAKLLLSERHSSCHVGPISRNQAEELEQLLSPVWKKH